MRPRPGSVARVALLALLAVALWDPKLPGTPAPVTLLVLRDESASAARTRPAEAGPAVAAAAAALPPGSRVGLVRFAAAPRLEMAPLAAADPRVQAALAGAASPAGVQAAARPASPPTHPPTISAARPGLDTGATDIGAAIREALALPADGAGRVLLVVSDGWATDGDAGAALALAAGAGVRVRWLAPDALGAARDDRWIESLTVPPTARGGRAVAAVAALGGHAAGPVRVVLSVDGVAVASREVRLRPGALTAARFALRLQDPGVHELRARLAGHDAEPDNDAAGAVVEVLGPPAALLLSARPTPPPLAARLAARGWHVRVTAPAHFPRVARPLRDAALVVLDDVAVPDLPATAWQALAAAVRRHGTGLLVLGGPRSFAAGAYRHSRLEGLLPVTAEAPAGAGRAAVQFVVDKSGSMERALEGVSRLAYARAAMVETARGLMEGDRVGLIVFDARPRELLPLAAHARPAAALDAAWRGRAAGGTLLAPALAAGIERLAASDADQRLLVLVTDGFRDGAESLAPAARALAAHGVDLLALVVGTAADGAPATAALAALARVGDGRLLRVGRIADLPRLMRVEVERRRTPARRGRAQPREVRPVPGLGGGLAWPPVEAFAVTRERPSARVLLRAPGGEPLLAAGDAGLGRVVALPAGLGEWAPAWRGWRRFDDFAGAIFGWAAARAESASLHLRATPRGRTLALALEDVGAGGEWRSGGDARATLTTPAGEVREQALEETAPGRYEASIAAPLAGRYTVAARAGDARLRRSVVHGGPPELIPGAAPGGDLDALAAAGRIERWRPGEPLALTGTAPAAGLRERLLLVAALGYLALLVIERAGPLAVAARRRPRPHPRRGRTLAGPARGARAGLRVSFRRPPAPSRPRGRSR